MVLFLGVLYHLRDPWAGLAKVAAMTAPGGVAIIETHVDMLHVQRPVVALYPGGELNADWSNWCGPNPAGLLALCQMAGFAESWIHGPTPGYEQAPDDPEEVAATARVVAHARK